MITYVEKKPTVEEYKELRNSADWNLVEKGISDERAQKSLNNAPLCICAYDNGKLVGMVRLAGDLQMYGYIQDTIVLPDYKGKGVGTEMLKKIIERVSSLEGYLLGVCPSKVAVQFYEKFGFKKRPQEPNGFMSIEVKKH